MELTVSDTNENMAYWLQRPYLKEETRTLMSGKDVLIVPEEDLREFTTPLFPSNLIALYDELKKHFQVEAAINDEDYHELALNNRIHKFGKFVVVFVVVPTFVAVLGNYISEKIKHEDPKDEIQLEIIVEGNNGQSKSVKYTGSANDFNKVAEKVKALAQEQNEHRTDTTLTTQRKQK